MIVFKKGGISMNKEVLTEEKEVMTPLYTNPEKPDKKQKKKHLKKVKIFEKNKRN